MEISKASQTSPSIKGFINVSDVAAWDRKHVMAFVFKVFPSILTGFNRIQAYEKIVDYV